MSFVIVVSLYIFIKPQLFAELPTKIWFELRSLPYFPLACGCAIHVVFVSVNLGTRPEVARLTYE